MCCSITSNNKSHMAASNDNNNNGSSSTTALHSSGTILPMSPTTTGRRRLKQQQKRWQQQRCSNKTKTVSFAKFDVTYDIPHSDDLTDMEFDSVWYSPYEIKQIRKEACSIVKRMINQDDDDMSGYCLRGLDQHTKEYMDKRQVINDFIMDAVIHRLQPFKTKVAAQQQTQQPGGGGAKVDIDQVISDLCVKYSACATESAFYRAKQDEDEARAIYFSQQW